MKSGLSNPAYNFLMSWVYHPLSEGSLVPWAYNGRQMTQLNQFCCRLMKFIFVPVHLNDELCSELYNLGLPAEGKNDQTP